MDFSLFQDAQHLGLRFQAHVSDFIQEDCPAVGLVKLARFALGGARKSALLMAEELRLDELLGNGRAVHLDERLLGPQAVVVDGPGNKLLARSALSVDKHGGVGGRRFEDILPQLLHQGMVADELVAFLRFAPQVLAFAAEAGLGQGIAQADQDPLPVERFFQELEGAPLGGLHGTLNGSVAGDDDHFRRERLGLDFGQNFQPIQPGQFDVQEDKVHAQRLLQDGKCFFAGGGFQDREALILQDHPQRFADVFLVVYDQNFGLPLISHDRSCRRLFYHRPTAISNRHRLDGSKTCDF
ncbi:MAG: hypothetical protein WCB96_02970 [Candidatus Aminicenantales bacterium]